MWKICFGCLRKIDEHSEQCPFCGFSNKEYKPEQHHIPPACMLNNRYVIGRVLGEGGFGITYVGYDTKLEAKVAIKEYFPHGIVIRDVTGEHGNTISTFSGEKHQMYEKYLSRFYTEAKTLAKLRGIDGLVSVLDYFMENETAYIVMEYVEGKDLKAYANEKGGKLPEEELLKLMHPVAESLVILHKNHIIHRDISPDNIMMDNKGKVMLIDLGASREFGDLQSSMSVLLKPGYAPLEQYNSNAAQGPYTDVYALCATMYRLITGVRPVDVVDRIAHDAIKRPSEFKISISSHTDAAIMKGLAVSSQDRFQTMEELMDSLYSGKRVWKMTRRIKKIIISCSMAAGIIVVFGIYLYHTKGGLKENKKIEEKEVLVVAETTVPKLDLPIYTNEDGLVELNLSNMNLSDLDFLDGYDFKDVKKLDLSYNSNLIDLSGLSCFPNLEVLDLSHDKMISDIAPLRKLKQLKSICLDYCSSIADFSILGEITTIEKLFLNSANVQDITFMRTLKNLKGLMLEHNLNLHDVSVLSELKNLKGLSIGNNENNIKLENIPEMPQLTHLGVWNEDDLDVEKFPNLEDIFGFNLGISIEKYAKLKKLKRLQIYHSDIDYKKTDLLKSVEELCIGKLYFLSDIGMKKSEFKKLDFSKMPSLVRLTVFLEFGTETELSWLLGTTKFEELSICQNVSGVCIRDVSSCADNANMRKLEIVGMFDCDLSVLKNLSELRELTLKDDYNEKEYRKFNPDGKLSRKETDHIDLNFISSLTNLEKLDLSVESCEDYSFMERLSKLKEVTLSKVSGENNFSFLKGLGGLEKLSVQDVKMADFSAVGKLVNLKEFSAPSAAMMNTSFLVPLTKLEKLDISGKQNSEYDMSLSNLDFLENKESLLTLDISNRAIKDCSGLSGAGSLLSLNMSGCTIDSGMEAFDSLKYLNSLTMSGCTVDLSALSGLQNLGYLDVSNGGIYGDATDMEGFGNLKSVLANNSSMQDLTWLKNAGELRKINLSGTIVKELSPLKKCPLQLLVLTGTHIDHLYDQLNALENVDGNIKVYYNSGDLSEEEVKKLQEKFPDGLFTDGEYK